MTKRTRRTAIMTAVAALSALLMVGASLPPGNEALGLLPAGPALVLSADRPMSIVGNAVAFMTKAGFADQASAVRSMVDGFLASGDSGGVDPVARLARSADLNRRVTVALYMRETLGEDGEPQQEPGLIAYLPVRDRIAMEAALRELAASGGAPEPIFSIELPGYLAVGIGMEPRPAGRYEAADLSALAAYPSSTLAVWADVPALRAMAGSGLSSALGGILGGPSDEDWEEWDEDEYYEEEYYDEEWDESDEEVEDWGYFQEGDEEEPGDEGELGYEEDFDWDSYLSEEEPAEGEELAQEEEWDDEEYSWDEEWDDQEYAQDEEYDEEYDWDDEEYAWDEDWDEEWDFEPSPDPLAMFAPLVEYFTELAEGIGAIDFGLTVSPDRVWLRTGMGALPGSALAEAAAAASAGERGIPYLSYCEADALMAGAWSSSMDWALGFIEPLYAAILPQEGAAELVMDSLRRVTAASGRHGAFYMDLGVSDGLAKALQGDFPGEAEASALIASGLSLNASGVMQLRDRQAYRDALAASIELMQDPAYRALLEGSGFSATATRSVGANAGVPFDLITMNYELAEGAGPEAAAVKALMAKLSTYSYAYADDKAFFSFGPAIEAVNMARRNGAFKPLSAERSFRELRAGAPLDSRGVFYLSSRRLMRLIMQFMPERGPLPFAYGDLTGLLSWFSASPGRLGWGMGLGAEDIKAFKSLVER